MIIQQEHYISVVDLCIQVIEVIVKIVTPCFNRPSLLSRSLVDSEPGVTQAGFNTDCVRKDAHLYADT